MKLFIAITFKVNIKAEKKIVVDKEKKISESQVNLINASLSSALGSSVFLYTIGLYAVCKEFGCSLFTPLLWVGIVGIIYRVYLMVVLRKKELSDETWLKLHLVSITTSGMFYALLALETMWFKSMANILVVYIIIAGVSAGACTTYSSVKKFAYVFLCIALIPLIIAGIVRGEGEFYLIPLTTVLFFVFMYKVVDESNKTFMSTITQGIEIQDLNIEKKSIMEHQEMRSNFFASVSHEIRTPLNGIFGLVDVLKDSKLTKEQEEHIDTIKNVSYDLLKVINDVLDLSKLDMGKVSLEKKPFIIGEVINDIVKLHNPKSALKGGEIKVIFGKTLPDVLIGDTTRIKQVLNNLTSNGVKYSDKGNVIITADYIDERLIIEVEDDGIGIPLDRIDSIFNRYEQIKDLAENKVKITDQGTGLGLSISKELIELMNGEISVSSIYGEGTKFTISLPLVKGVLDKSQVLVKDKMFNKKVLLVDDREINIKVGQLLLKNLGCEVIIANNGKEALNILANQYLEIDLVLMDIQMPVMDGLEAMKNIKTKYKSHPPVFALSAQVESNLEFDSIDYGFAGYLTKPVNKEILSKALLTTV